MHTYRVLNPHRGWIPVDFGFPEARDFSMNRPYYGSVAAIEDLLTGENIVLKLPPSLIDELPFSNADILDYRNMQGEVYKGSFVKILESVRNIILNWSLELEAQNVLGDDMSFSDKEKEAASHVPLNVTIGDITGSQVQVNSAGSRQEMKSDTGAIEALKSFVEAFDKEVQNNNDIDQSIQDELMAEIATLKAQASSPNPKRAVIVETLVSIRNILEGAVGGVLSNAALPAVTGLIANFNG